LGIVIGVFTVVSMMALSTGLKASIDRGMGVLGANTFSITRTPPLHFGPLDPSIWRRKIITIQQAQQLRDLLPQAKLVAPENDAGGRLAESRYGKAQPVTVVGGTDELFAVYSFNISAGRNFSGGEAVGDARVAVLGASVVDALFPGMNPIGESFKIGRMSFEVIGTLQREGGSPFGFSADTMVCIPIATFSDLFGGGRSLDVSVMANSDQDLPKLMDASIAAFRRVRGLTNTQDNDFEVFTNDSLRATFDELAGSVGAATLAICALSLLVGGIGVMNIMLVAVAERTREIGLRKALGARRSRILFQFIIEAVLLATLGGVIGIVLGYGAAWLTDFVYGVPARVPLWSVALGLGTSCGIGLVFGIYPAARASKLDAAVALRSE
jgi:putative ABC transport system permease protein